MTEVTLSQDLLHQEGMINNNFVLINARANGNIFRVKITQSRKMRFFLNTLYNTLLCSGPHLKVPAQKPNRCQGHHLHLYPI